MGRFTRRTLVAYLAGSRLALGTGKPAVFPAEWKQYSDPSTDLPVVRLTSPDYASYLPAPYQRAVARRGGFLLFASERAGSLQPYRMDLKSGAFRQIAECEALDPASLTLLPDEHGFCFFDGPSLRVVSLAGLHPREIYRVPEGWRRCAGSSVSSDGAFALFGERQDAVSRLRLVAMRRPAARTVTEAPWALSHPLARPQHTQALYRQGDEALWIVNYDGRGNRRLDLAAGSVGPADWAPKGETLLYLNFPLEPTELNNIREFSPDENSDHQVAKTSQFVSFAFNHDTSVFVGASRNAASPSVLLLLRVGRRELTLCEHHARDPRMVQPVFSPDSRLIFFQSDRDGKPAIYCLHVEKLVAQTDETSGG